MWRGKGSGAGYGEWEHGPEESGRSWKGGGEERGEGRAWIGALCQLKSHGPGAMGSVGGGCAWGVGVGGGRVGGWGCGLGVGGGKLSTVWGVGVGGWGGAGAIIGLSVGSHAGRGMKNVTNTNGARSHGSSGGGRGAWVVGVGVGSVEWVGCWGWGLGERVRGVVGGKGGGGAVGPEPMGPPGCVRGVRGKG